ncbi:HutD/Ves family protein [Quadrisphaera granulorum]|uniref:HutD/Ves family protein n=1 Tax=Quadrisphaera granulorum TaxID=317664 RepID=UPI0014765DAD|nr:HutD family protein [Quadrisphaera granulorum]
MPWRNGQGTTRELRPRSEHDGGWWVSVADLTQPGPFSSFPGVERVFTPVGADVELTVDGTTHQLPAGRPFRFDGEADVSAALPWGPARAINVFAERSVCRVDVRRRQTQQLVRPGTALVVLEGTAHLADGRDLGPLDLVEGPAHVLGTALVINVAPIRPSSTTHP